MRSLAVLLTAVRGQDLFLESRGTEGGTDADVIIIGAGWAGMAAAHHLHQAGTSFLVLEGDSLVGGRTRSIEFGSEAVGKYMFEQGSNWVCGSGLQRHDDYAPTVTINPVLTLAREAGLQTAHIPGATDGNMSNYFKVYDEFGHDADPDGSLRDKANAALDCLNKTAGDAKVSKTVRDGLTACGWDPQTNAEWAMDWATVSDESGVLAKSSALAGFLPDPTYDWWGPDDELVVEQHPRGFARLIDHMVKDTVPVEPLDSRVKLNTKVSKINWDKNGVTILTENGQSYKAKHAISTMSLGVIRRNNEALFEPKLPSKQRKNLNTNHMPMANLTHVLIQFPEVWWDNSLPAWVSANEGGKDNRGKFVVWHNLNADGFVPGSKTLLSFLGEPEASQYGDMTEAEMMPVIMERLRAQNPELTLPAPSAAWMKNWGTDPLFYGAYAYSEPGISWSDDWKAPLKVKRKTIVQFAGEATCGNLDGYVHGALQSGKEAAAAYLHEYEHGPNPEKSDDTNLCEWYNYYYYN